MDKEIEIERSIQGIFSTSFITIIPFLIMAVGNFFDQKWLDTMDQSIGQAVVDFRVDSLTPFMRFMTSLGGTKFSILFLAIVCLLFFFVIKRRDLALWYGLTGAFGAGALNQIIKFMFKKQRPIFEHLVDQGGYTFPSGHSMGAVIVYGGLLFLIFQLIENDVLKRVLPILTVILILLIGFSRLYLGVHFISDVIGGYSLGTASLLACIGLYQTLDIKQYFSKE